MFNCSSVPGIGWNPFDKKINFIVRPNCLTDYLFMSIRSGMATVALVILITLNFCFLKVEF